jgi:hypothetical protein
MWIEIRTFHDIEVSDSLTYLTDDKDALTKEITKPWRFFHAGRWWLAFGSPVIGAVSQNPARQTKTYTVFRTKARPTKSMKYPVGGVWDMTRAIPQMDGSTVNPVTGSQTTHMSMKDYLANQPGLDAARELMFNTNPTKEKLMAIENVSRKDMANVPNIGDMVIRLLNDKIMHKVNEMRKNGLRVDLVDHPTIKSEPDPFTDPLTGDVVFTMTQKVVIRP